MLATILTHQRFVMRLTFTVLITIALFASRGCKAEQYNYQQDDAYYDANHDDVGNYYEEYGDDYVNSQDYIKYWTDYAVLPKRCIVYNDVDMIVFSVFSQHWKQCVDEPMGTYITTVPYFVQGYLAQKQQDTEDQGNEYEAADVEQYAYCTPFQIQNVYYYFQVGCSDTSTQELAINIYSDKTCTNRSKVDGYDDSNLDVSALQFSFKKCRACVNWFDRDDDANAIDDQYYENHQMSAPLCSNAWKYKETCGRKCQHTGLDKEEGEGWNTSDKILLGILTMFSCIMLGLIVRKRQRMSNKDALLEQAAMSAAGLQQPHVIGLFVLVILVIAVFALLGLKNITWALLLITNTVLFAYLMKLTVDSGVSTGESVIGPDGTILRRDSDDSSMESSRESNHRNAGTFMLPTLT